eukprot:scpid926/ scgid20577/ 
MDSALLQLSTGYSTMQAHNSLNGGRCISHTERAAVKVKPAMECCSQYHSLPHDQHRQLMIIKPLRPGFGNHQSPDIWMVASSDQNAGADGGTASSTVDVMTSLLPQAAWQQQCTDDCCPLNAATTGWSSSQHLPEPSPTADSFPAA